jgi:putative oxidoreductase
MTKSDGSSLSGPCVAPFVLRFTLAVVLFPHGAQKLLGWFGGYGFHGTMGYFESAMHLPAFLALAAILVEFFCPILLFFGLFTRFVAAVMGIHMLVAMLMVHVGNGFFMNWTGAQKGEGFEYHLLFIGIALALVISGSGCCSIDRLICKQRHKDPASGSAPAPASA